MITRRRAAKTSAGILLYRHSTNGIEVFLVHPGGPFFRNKDEGAWTIPKGEALPEEDLLSRAQTEFEEELGIRLAAEWIPLGSVKQKGGKTVHAWAFESDLPAGFELKSNTFEIEWPPRSGKRQKFPEIDQAVFFLEELAAKKINPAQALFLSRLRETLGD